MTETLCTSGAVKNKAGANASSTVTGDPTIMTQFINQAEGHLCAETRVNWLSYWPTISGAAYIKTIEGAVAAKAAISVINYDLISIGTNQATTRINVLRDEYTQAVKVLSDDKLVTGIGAVKLS